MMLSLCPSAVSPACPSGLTIRHSQETSASDDQHRSLAYSVAVPTEDSDEGEGHEGFT